MASVEDVTKRLLADVSGPGEYVKRVHAAKPARTLSPTLAAFFDKWKASGDKTVGYVSNALAYGKGITGWKASHHLNMIRLIKGGHINVCKVAGKPPQGSAAHRETPYGDQFYLLQPNACPVEVDPAAAPFMGARRRRR